MIYATRYEDATATVTTLVAAADSMGEFAAFADQVAERGGRWYTSQREPSDTELLLDQRLRGLRHPLLLFEHVDGAQALAFAHQCNLQIVAMVRLVDRQRAMLPAPVVDPYAQDAPDQRPIGEILELQEDDPWDQRSDAEIGADRARGRAGKRHRAAQVTGDSFAPPPSAPSAAADAPSVHRIYGHRDAAGRLHIDHALASKPGGAPEPDSTVVDIDPDGPIGIYYKVAVSGAKRETVYPLLTTAGLALDEVVVSRNHPDGSWLAVVRRGLADQMAAHLSASGLAVEVYAVTDRGVRVLAAAVEGVTVLSEADRPPTPRRPWHDSPDADAGVSNEELRGAEFYFTGRYRGAQDGTIIYIAPRDYFDRHGTLYPAALNLDALLPDDLVEQEPGIYVSRVRDWLTLSNALGQCGFRQSLLLQLHINQRGSY